MERRLSGAEALAMVLQDFVVTTIGVEYVIVLGSVSLEAPDRFFFAYQLAVGLNSVRQFQFLPSLFPCNKHNVQEKKIATLESKGMKCQS